MEDYEDVGGLQMTGMGLKLGLGLTALRGESLKSSRLYSSGSNPADVSQSNLILKLMSRDFPSGII